MKITITPEAKSVLVRSEITGCLLVLPQQLPRPLYNEVMKVLDAGGGRWDRKVKGHVFPSEQRLNDLRQQWENGDKATHVKKATQAFYTPTDLAAELVEWACIESGARVLEPSAGEGALVLEIANHTPHIVAAELDPVSAEKLRPLVEVLNVGDFLTMDHFGSFDAIVMNPPFTKGADIKHVRHAWKFLKPGGMLVAIMSPGWQSGTIKSQSAFRAFVEEHGEAREIEAGTFSESGTGIRTVMVKLRKPVSVDDEPERAPERAPRVKVPATPAARELRGKLERLAEQGINGEKTAAQGKLARLLARYDFTAPDTTTADLFAGSFAVGPDSVEVLKIAEPDIANAVKWSFECAARVPCGFRGEFIIAQAKPATAARMFAIGETIASSFRVLWNQYRAAGGDARDRGSFILGLSEGMMREERTGEALPRRVGDVGKLKAKKRSVALAPGLSRHPYSVAVELGRQIRFEVPISDLQEQLEKTIKGEIEL